MAINPDNFIFHSDFWYPTGYKSGSLSLTNVSIPATFTLSNEYNDGDYFNVYLEYPPSGGFNGGIGERFISDTIIPFTDGNNLKVFKGAQSVGATFTGTLHWRIYPKNTKFNFNSTGLLEQTAKSLDGFITAPGGVNSFNIDIPSGLTGKYFARGTWQIDGQSANIIGGASTNGDFSVYYDYLLGKLTGFMTTYPGVLPAGTKIFYKIQLVPITPQDVYIFNSDKYSFALPSVNNQDIVTAATMGANATNVIYGDWVDIPGSKTAADLLVKWSGSPGVVNQHYREIQFTPNITAVATIETSGTQARPVLTVTNFAASSQSYSTQTVSFGIYFYQNNNA